MPATYKLCVSHDDKLLIFVPIHSLQLEPRATSHTRRQEKGEAESILNAVSAIDTCLREPPGRFKCATVQGEFDGSLKDSSGKFGGLFGQ